MRAGGTGRVTEGRVLLVSAFGAFLAFLDATIVNVAFPSIRESFPGTSIGELSWVLNAYNIVFAAFLIVCGRLADLLGRRRTFVLGVLVFTVASALCGAAPTVGLLVAARVLQALGAALLAEPVIRSIKIDEAGRILAETSDARAFYTIVPGIARQSNVRLFEIEAADESLESVFSYLVQR